MSERYKVIPYVKKARVYMQTADEIAKGCGMEREQVRSTLRSAACRGVLICTRRNGVSYYTLKSALDCGVFDDREVFGDLRHSVST